MLYFKRYIEDYFCLPTIVFFNRLYRPFTRRVRGFLSPFAILKVVLYILTVFLVIGPPFANIEPDVPGDVVRIFKESFKGGPSPIFEGV